MLNTKRIDLSMFPERSNRPKLGLQFFAEPAPAPEPTPAPSPAQEPSPAPNPAPELEPAPNDEAAAQAAAELKRLQAELSKQKNALDAATKEAANYKKQLRAKLSTEEQEAEAAKERQEAMEAELAALRKQSAMGAISKKVMTFISDENTADGVAEALYGAEDVDAAIDAIAKAWTAKEKELRLEFSKLPPPAPGGDSSNVQKDVEEGHKFGKAKMASMQSSNEGLKKFMK